MTRYTATKLHCQTVGQVWSPAADADARAHARSRQSALTQPLVTDDQSRWIEREHQCVRDRSTGFGHGNAGQHGFLYAGPLESETSHAQISIPEFKAQGQGRVESQVDANEEAEG